MSKPGFWVFPIIVFALLIIGFSVVFLMAAESCNQFKEDYMRPDTTIVIKNGVADTTVVKKSKPWWLQ